MRTTTMAVMLTAALTMATVGLASGCREDGPAEEIGEEIDEAAEEAKDKLD